MLLLGLAAILIGIVCFGVYAERIAAHRQPFVAMTTGAFTPLCLIAGIVLVSAGMRP